MKRKWFLSIVSLLALVAVVWVVFDFTEAETKVASLHVPPHWERSSDYDVNVEQSLEIYKELKDWTKINAGFPYAGAFIDEQGILNVRVKDLNSGHEVQLTDLFGDYLILRDADATFRQLEDVYLKLQDKFEEFIENGIALDGFYIDESDNKVYIELLSAESQYINEINAVIGDHPFVEYIGFTDMYEEGFNYTGTIIKITRGKTFFQDKKDGVRLFVDTNEESEMYFSLDHRTEMIGVDIEDLEVGDQVKILAPYLIEQEEPPSTLAARVALDN